MAQYLIAQILLAVVRVDQFAQCVLTVVWMVIQHLARHGIDGQITPRQVLLQRDVGREMHGKTVVALCGFALGTRQRVFIVAHGV